MTYSICKRPLHCGTTLAAAVLAALGLFIAVSARTAQSADRPNVLLIMPDDVSWDDFSLYNPQGPRTPNIDALGRASVRLTETEVNPGNRACGRP